MHNFQPLSSQFVLALKQSRPRFWLYTAGPFLLGSIVGFVFKSNEVEVQYVYIIAMFLYFLLMANYLMYGVNDYFDFETDLLNPKKDSKEVRVTSDSRSGLKKWLIFATILSAVLIFFQPSFLTAGILIAFLFGAIGYSVPPLRFKDRVLVDSFSNGFYVLPGFLGYAVFVESLSSVIFMIACWAWAMAMHLYSAIPDIKYDKSAGIKTTAVWLGATKSYYVCFVLWLFFAMAVLQQLGLRVTTVILFVYPLIPLGHLFYNSLKIEKMYWWFPYITTTIGAVATIEFLLNFIHLT